MNAVLPSFLAPRFVPEKASRQEPPAFPGLDRRDAVRDSVCVGKPRKKASLPKHARKFLKATSEPKKPDHHPQGVPQELVEKRPLSQMTDTERRNFDWLPASALSEQRLTDIFGPDGWKLKELADKRPQLKIGDLTGLRHDPEGLMAVREMLLERPDLGMADVTKRGKEGKLLVNPTIQHHASKRLLLNRHDLKPIELTRMGASFASWLRNPSLAHEAYRAALSLLEVRRNITPQDCEGMLATMITAVGGADKGGESIVDMFKAGASLLKKRPDITPIDVLNMARETGKQSGQAAQQFRQGSEELTDSRTLGIYDFIRSRRLIRHRHPALAAPGVGEGALLEGLAANFG